MTRATAVHILYSVHLMVSHQEREREREDVHRRATFAEADSERGQSFEIINLIMCMQRQKSGRAARVSERAPKRNRAEKRNASSGNAINIQHLTGRSIAFANGLRSI